MICQKRKHLGLMMALVMLAWLSPSQDILIIDLDAAKTQAVQYNKTLKNSGMAIDKAHLAVKEAVSAGLPQVSSSVDYNNALGAVISIRFQEGMEPTEIPIKPTSNLGIQVGQLLFNGSYFVGIELAKAARSMTEKSYEKTEQDILVQVTNSYYLALVTRELLSLTKKNVDNLKEVHRKTDAMVRVGILEQTDLDQLSVQLSALENGVSASERQYELACNMLRMLMGMTAGTEFELAGSLNEVLSAGNLQPGMYSAFRPEQNIDFQLLSSQELLSEKQVRMQYAAFLPTLMGFYSRTQKILKPDFDMSPKNMVGLNLDIPIFSGGSRKHKVSQAKLDLETARNTRNLVAEQLEIQEKQMQFNLKNARENYLNQVKNLDVSRRVYDNLKLKFEHGMISGLDLVTADNNYVKSESDYISSIYQVLQAMVELDKLYGKIK